MHWKTNLRIFAIGGALLVSIAALGQRRFDQIEYLKPQIEGQKKDRHRVKGSVVFDREKSTVDFLDDKGVAVVSIPEGKVTSLLDENKLPLLPLHTHGATHYLTIQYTDINGIVKFVVIGDASKIVAVAEVEIGKMASRKDGCCRW